MAHSKSGGTRSYIRGKVGADVYSIGKDAKGKKQQVVRSLAETVSNPQTIAQMTGRMIMSTVMQAVSAMRVIIDHSFDGLAVGQPNISEFISRNYALIKADIAANFAENNAFGLNAYGEKGVKRGAYLVSDGKAELPSCLGVPANGAGGTITLTAETMTVGGLKAALALNSNEYITLLGFDKNGKFVYCRFRIDTELADETALTAQNIADVFSVEGNEDPTFTLAGNVFTVALNGANKGAGWIVSKKTDAGYVHNQCVISGVSAPVYTAEVALPTYPVGANNFLNGGEDAGSFSPAPQPEPTPVVQPSLTALTYAGTNVLAQSASAYDSMGAQIVGTAENIPSEGTLSLYIGTTKIGDIVTESFNFTDPGMTHGTTGRITLKLNGVVKQTCGEILRDE